MTKPKDIPLTTASRRLLARRAEFATDGLRRGYIDPREHTALIRAASHMAAVQTRRWWMPRPDQPWRYD